MTHAFLNVFLFEKKIRLKTAKRNIYFVISFNYA